MKAKTSITLSESLLRTVDRRAKQLRTNRSDFIETAVRAHLDGLAREEAAARDLELINRNADALNREAEDALDYQAEP